MKLTLKRVGLITLPVAAIVGLVLFFVLRNRSTNSSHSAGSSPLSVSEVSSLLERIPVWFSPSLSQRSVDPKQRLESFFSAMGWKSSLSFSEAQQAFNDHQRDLSWFESSMRDPFLTHQAVHLTKLFGISPENDLSEFSHLPVPGLGPVFAGIGSKAEIFKSLVEGRSGDLSKLLSKAAIALWAFPEFSEVSMDAFVDKTCERLQQALLPGQQLPRSWQAVCEPTDKFPTFSKLFNNILYEYEFFVILSSTKYGPTNPLFGQYLSSGRFSVHSWGIPNLMFDEYRRVVDPHLFKMCSKTPLGKYCEALELKRRLLGSQGVSEFVLRRLSDKIQDSYRFKKVKVDHEDFPIVNIQESQTPAVTALETAILFVPQWPVVLRLAAVVDSQDDEPLQRELELGVNVRLVALMNELQKECRKPEHKESKAVCVNTHAELAKFDMSDFEQRSIDDVVDELLAATLAE